MKRKVAITFALVIILTMNLLASCGESVANRQIATAAGTVSPEREGITTLKSDESVEKGPFGKYEPSIDVTFVRTLDEDTASNILPRTPGETMEDNRWLEAYSQKLGININYDWIVNGGYEDDAYIQKLNVTLASGGLPDVIPVGLSQLKQLSDADMIVDLTPYWNDYASDTLKGYYTANSPAILGSSTFDGRLMGITSFTDGFNDGVFIWIRADWLRKLGLSPPKTMDELLAVAHAFTTQDPDGNGINDTYGFAVTKDLSGSALGLEGFFAGYHAYPNIWVENDSGRLVYGSTLPEVKMVLQVLADLYQSGEIDSMFAVKDLSNVADSLVDGKIGIEFGAQWNPMYPLISSYNKDTEADWTGFPLVSIDSRPACSPSKFMLDNMYYAVNKDYEHPEALIKMLNLHVELCWGETGDFDYYYMPKAKDSVGVWKFSPVYPSPPFKNIAAFKDLANAHKNGTLKRLTGESAAIQRNIEAFQNGDVSQWGWNKIYGPEGVYRWSMSYFSNGLFMWDKFTGAPTPTMAVKMNALVQMERELFTKIIMGAAPLDEFDRFVEDWYKIGGTEMTNEVNEWYSGQ